MDSQPTELNYVALGDSFSSAEGVEPFTSPSDTNDCHRSEDAYPVLLDRDYPLLNLTAFVACSGAGMSNITSSGQGGEGAQKLALSGDTDVATITIGGNDVGFGDVISICINEWANDITTDPSCDDLLTFAENQVDNLGSSLETTYGQIAAVVTKPTARVLVVGYPHVLPESVSGPFPPCSAYAFDNTQLQRVWDLTDELNSLIETKATAEGFEFIDVDAQFAEHRLCSSDSYFNGVDAVNNEYSYHPNQQGQEAYAELIANIL